MRKLNADLQPASSQGTMYTLNSFEKEEANKLTRLSQQIQQAERETTNGKAAEKVKASVVAALKQHQKVS